MSDFIKERKFGKKFDMIDIKLEIKFGNIYRWVLKSQNSSHNGPH